ncbi:MAG TPA: murein biosynthesis integral membrane protein MurJ [Candidatus Saccharimonadales bacterium]|nr:murein biosynthesis integral membrane protein MurJ [Candidatus Saccharimonadales bacterium]
MQDKQAVKTKKKTRISLGNVALLLMITTLIGQLLGFLRTKLVNANFPSTGPESTGAYFAAFTIPDFFFYTLAAGALGVAFMPILAERMHKGDKRGVWELSGSLMNLLSMVMLAVGVIIFVFAEPLIKHVVAPGLTEPQLDNAVTIMRFLSLNPFFFTLSGVLTATQQTLGRFFFYAIAPLFYNLSIIASIYIFEGTEVGLVGLGIGACVGGILQLLVVALGLIGTKFHWRPKIAWRSNDFRTILHQLPPRSLDQGMDQLQAVVETRFASRLGTEFISHYNNAYTLHMAPILLLGTAISTAAFPQLNMRIAQGRPDLFRRDFLRVLRIMVWLTIPVVIICYFARGYLARLIFSRDAPEIALIFGFLTVAIFFRVVYAIISRWFYAQKDTKTPLIVSIFVILLNILLASMLARPSTYGIAGLAISQSIVAMTEVVILLAIMLIRDKGLFSLEFWGAMLKILSVAGFSLVAGYLTVSFFPLEAGERGFLTLGTKLAIIASTISCTYLVVSAIFGLEEAKAVFNRVRRIILKPIKVQY